MCTLAETENSQSRGVICGHNELFFSFFLFAVCELTAMMDIC